jgi:hypothetical protein
MEKTEEANSTCPLLMPHNCLHSGKHMANNGPCVITSGTLFPALCRFSYMHGRQLVELPWITSGLECLLSAQPVRLFTCSRVPFTVPWLLPSPFQPATQPIPLTPFSPALSSRCLAAASASAWPGAPRPPFVGEGLAPTCITLHHIGTHGLQAVYLRPILRRGKQYMSTVLVKYPDMGTCISHQMVAAQAQRHLHNPMPYPMSCMPH